MRILALIYVSATQMRLYSAESGDTLDSSSILSMQVTSVDIWERDTFVIRQHVIDAVLGQLQVICQEGVVLVNSISEVFHS